jgi:hypothetical protein
VPSLHASVRQQLQQSGLLQQLPVLMIAAAVELSLQARDKSFLRHGETMAAGDDFTDAFYACIVRLHAASLLTVVCRSSKLWPEGIGRLNALAGSAAAAMQLALAVTRHLSAEVQEHMRSPGASKQSTVAMQVRLSCGWIVY